jgi:flap endonuclease-1
VHFIQGGIRPLYVFDGKPPEMKSNELAKRAERREQAGRDLEAAIEAGNQEEIDRFSRRTVRLDATQVSECQKLLTLMGIPFIDAPCEAEAECAALCRAGKAWATATEDMDALAHATPILVRHLSYSAGAGKDVIEINHAAVLEATGLTQEQFIDFCILCGCDYCDTIKGIGPKHAYEQIKKWGSIEQVIEHLDTDKYTVPELFDFANARQLFLHHEVITDIQPQWNRPDQEGLIQFLVNEKGFSQARVENVCKNLEKAKANKQQLRMDSFFKAAAPPAATAKPTSKVAKKPPVKPGKRK